MGCRVGMCLQGLTGSEGGNTCEQDDLSAL